MSGRHRPLQWAVAESKPGSLSFRKRGMRRIDLFSIVAVLLASAYPLLRGQEGRGPTRRPRANPATAGD